MIITFLIGNGFDINLGLKTKYNDFLPVYTKQAGDSETESAFHETNENNNSSIPWFKNTIEKNIDMWSNAELAFGNYTENFLTNGKNAEDFSECHEDFCEKLALYLDCEQSKMDFESNKEKIKQAFASAISFSNFIQNFRELQRQQLTDAARRFGQGYIYNFINFNYTTTLDTCTSLVKENNKILGVRSYNNTTYGNKIGQVVHIHGYTDRDMVLAVNDESQIKAPSLFDGYGEEYKNQLIKKKTNEMNEENIDKKVYDLLCKSDLIYIYGMSIGQTDALWWQRIIKLMVEKTNLHLIIYSYERPKSPLIRRTIQTFDSNLKKSFLSFQDIDENTKNGLTSRIHIDGENIFSGLTNIATESHLTQSKELIEV